MRVTQACDFKRYGLSSVSETAKGKNVPWILASVLEGARNPIYISMEHQLLAVYTAFLQVKPLTADMVATSGLSSVQSGW